jgi:hypothetical protein
MSRFGLTWEKKRGKCCFSYLGKEVFSPKSVVNLKNELKHNVSESIMRKDSSGGG